MAGSLKKQLTFHSLFAISTGTMISSGFFLLPGIAFGESGPAVIAAFFLAGLLTIPALLSQSELATAMPKAGGAYFFLDRSMGPLAGTIGGLGAWLSLVLKGGFALIGFSFYLALLISECFGYELPIQPTIVILCICLTGLNLAGAKKTGQFQWLLVTLVLSLLGIFIFKGLPQTATTHFSPFLPQGFKSLATTIGLVFISYAGLTQIASMAEETKNPDRNIPRAMVASLAVVMLVYTLGVTVAVGVLPPDVLEASRTPISDAAHAIMGDGLFYLITLAAIFAFISCANAGLLAASRYPFAMARDQIFPPIFKKINATHSPSYSVLLTSALTLFFVLTFDIEEVAKLASAFQLLLFAFINLAVIVMRESEIEDYAPGFRSPGYPWVQIFGIFSCLFIITELGFLEIIFSLGVVVLGVVWYFLYVNHRVKREGALKWVFERLSRRQDPQDSLIMELRQIQKERGLKKGDPFEEIVNRTPLIEIGEDENFERFFDQVGKYYEEKLGIDGLELKQTFLLLNKLGNTPVEAGIAIPHIRLEELEDFYMVMGRSQKGLQLPESQEPIYAIFVMLGPTRKSARHLRILAAIAVESEKKNFLERWKEAANVEEIRHLLLTDDQKENPEEDFLRMEE